MLDARAYLEHIRRDGERIAEVAEGHPDDAVPSCPGNTVASLLLHVAGVSMFWTAAIEQNRQPEVDWTKMNRDPLRAFVESHGHFVDELSTRDPDEPTWVWGRDPHMRFWYRRAAQELSIHRWDFENAVGDPLPIDPALAADGVGELFEEFGREPDDPNTSGAAKRFGGDGERLRLQATDVDRSWTVTARPVHFDVSADGDADVTARGTASDLNLFLWGRVPRSALEVSGDASLLDRWQERVKI